MTTKNGNENAADYAKKRAYFEKVALQHLPEMRLLFRGGKLTKKEGWRNVAEHCLAQIVVSKVLANLLDLDVRAKEELVRAAAVHDWAKRLGIKPKDFSDEERSFAEELLAKVKPNSDLLAATGPEFLERALVKKESTPLERLQFYIDDITKGSEIVRFDERVAEVEARRQDLNENAELTQKLGGRYWDKERELGHQVEQEIFGELVERGIRIDTPNEIPDLLNNEIRDEIARN